MRTPVLIGLTLALVACSPAPVRAAGLDLTWSACNTDGGLGILDLTCDDNAVVSELVGCFQLPSDMDSLFQIEISLDIEVDAGSLPAFWQFDAAGCNFTGLALSTAQPPSGCSGIANVWGTDGLGGDVTRAYISMYGGSPTRGRLIGSLFRVDSNPMNVTAETNMFAFRFLIASANATEAGGSCAGCTSPGVIVWNSAEFTSVATSAPPPVMLTNSGLTGQCARFNGGTPGACAATPTQHSTWGRLKSLYR